MSTTEQPLDSLQALTLTIPQAAQLLGISISKTYEAARAGQLPIIRIGTRVLISRKRLEDLVNGIDESVQNRNGADSSLEQGKRASRV